MHEIDGFDFESPGMMMPVELGAMVRADRVMGAEADMAERDFARRVYNPKLYALRAQHPFLKIAPVPNTCLSVLLIPGASVNLDLPSGTKMIRFNSDGIFFVSRNGFAQIPQNALATGQAPENGSFIPHFDTYYYVEEQRQLSIISDLPVRVTVECIAQV